MEEPLPESGLAGSVAPDFFYDLRPTLPAQKTTDGRGQMPRALLLERSRVPIYQRQAVEQPLEIEKSFERVSVGFLPFQKSAHGPAGAKGDPARRPR